jgi:ABC-type uncharacterized transport system substrate-binding protein
VRAFRQGLNETGYVEGRNVVVEFRWAHGKYDDLPELITDLVHRRVDIIVTNGPSVSIAKAATVTIPIVFVVAGDPVGRGFVASLNHPGGNLTGITNLNLELGPKRLELLHELLPTADSVAILVNPTNPNTESLSRDLEAAARDLGLQVHFLRASTEADFQLVLPACHNWGLTGLLSALTRFSTARSNSLLLWPYNIGFRRSSNFESSRQLEA